MTTPNMNLTLPVVSQTPGPTWASDINADLSVIDEHNHTSGKGALVPVAGLDIDADLSLATHALTNVAKVALLNQVSNTTAGSVYAVGGDLWWKNGSGTGVQVTSGNAINVGGTGNIGGLPNLAAAVNYVSGSLSFQFIDENGAAAGLLAGGLSCNQVLLDNVTLNTSAGTSAYTLNVPTGAVAAASFVTATVGATGTQLGYLTQAGGITRTMQAAVGEQIAAYASSPSFSSASLALNPVTITTTGRPLVIGIQSPAGVGTPSYVDLNGDGVGWHAVQVGISVTSASPPVGFTAGIYANGVVSGYIAALGEAIRIPVSSVSGVYALPAGTYTVQPWVGTPVGPGSTKVVTINGQVYAYEL